MNTPKQQKDLKQLAKFIDLTLEEISGERMGYFLCLTSFNDDGVAGFISNINKKHAIEMMEETLERLKADESIYETKGNA